MSNLKRCECHKPDCKACRFFANPAVVALLAKPLAERVPANTGKRQPRAKPAKAASAPCRYRGDKILNGEAARLSLDVRRNWHPCSHPDLPLGEYVCPCRGCGSKCPGYAA